MAADFIRQARFLAWRLESAATVLTPDFGSGKSFERIELASPLFFSNYLLMKTSVILSIVCIGVGIAIGWIAKPAPEAEMVQATPPEASKRKEPKPSDASALTEKKQDRQITPSVRVIGGSSPEEMSEEDREEVAKYQDRFGEMMKKRQMAKLDARISKLVAQLNLTPDQEAALRKAAEESMGDVSDLDFEKGDYNASNIFGLTGEPLEDALTDILTEEQKEEHEALKKRELANKIEARALKDLAKLSKLDMTQEQKDAAYDILYKQAEESTGQESPGNDVFSAVTAGFGIEIDAADLGLDFSVGGDIYESAKEGEAPNPENIMERMKENRQKKIDQQVEALRPVLNETQLEQYRKDLEIKSQGFLGGMGFGLETE